MLPCGDGDTCVLPTQICDGQPQCSAGTDEARCDTVSAELTVYSRTLTVCSLFYSRYASPRSFIQYILRHTVVPDSLQTIVSLLQSLS